MLRLGLLEGVVVVEDFNHLDKGPGKVQGVVEQLEDLDHSDLSLDLHQSMGEIKGEDLMRESLSTMKGELMGQILSWIPSCPAWS